MFNIENLVQSDLNEGKTLRFTSGVNCGTCHCQLTEDTNYIVSESMYSGIDTASTEKFEDCIVTRIYCKTCETCCAICVRDSWVPIENVLIQRLSLGCQITFEEVTQFWQRFVLWVLNTVLCCRETKSEEISCANIPPNEFAKILRSGTEAVGFYIVKLKGCQYARHKPECYNLPVLDFAYVRKSFRGRNLGTAIVEDMVKTFPHQDLGFSTPISKPMYRVLRKYLQEHIADRARIWETEWIGCEGDKRNVWFELCRKAINTKREK